MLIKKIRYNGLFYHKKSTVKLWTNSLQTKKLPVKKALLVYVCFGWGCIKRVEGRRIGNER